jgi:hypothetical protein
MRAEKRLLVVALTLDLVASVFVDALDGRNVDRRRQIVDDRVEQRLHALVLEGRAAEHRIERASQHGLTDQSAACRLVRLGAVEVGFHRVIVEFDGGFDQLLAIFLGLLDQVGRNVDGLVLRAERFAFQI